MRKLSKNILIVDDDLVILEDYSLFLEENFKDYNFYKCSRAEDCLKLIKEVKFDIAILDIFLDSETSGEDIAYQLIVEQPKSRIIFITANVTDNSKMFPRSTFLTKPIRMQELKEVVEETIDLGNIDICFIKTEYSKN